MTGVQTCALPICAPSDERWTEVPFVGSDDETAMEPRRHGGGRTGRWIAAGVAVGAILLVLVAALALGACLLGALALADAEAAWGDEVILVQAYLRFKRKRPSHAKLFLRGFCRTQLLHVGERRPVTFAFSERDLSLYWVNVGDWVRPIGIEVHIGASSTDIRQVIAIS